MSCGHQGPASEPARRSHPRAGFLACHWRLGEGSVQSLRIELAKDGPPLSSYLTTFALRPAGERGWSSFSLFPKWECSQLECVYSNYASRLRK